MKILINRIVSLPCKTIVLVIIIVLSPCWAFAEHNPLETLHGPAFTDPIQIMDMPDAWKKQTIQYGPKSADADLVISLDQQMYPAFLPLIQEYAKNNNLKIIVKNGTCGISSGMLASKTIDIGGYCCAPGLTDRLPGLRFHTIGIASLSLIVHQDNPVDNLTIHQAREIFMGEISRWSEIRITNGRKGPNLPIQPVGRLHCKLRAGHWRLLLDNEDIFSPNLLEVGAIPDMISQVSINKRAIGYESLWMIHNFLDKGKVKILNINGYDPAYSSHLLSGDYPLYRVYNLTTWEDDDASNPLSKKIVDYIFQQVKHMDSKFKFVPASRLREAGWKFYGNELVGEPD